MTTDVAFAQELQLRLSREIAPQTKRTGATPTASAAATPAGPPNLAGIENRGSAPRTLPALAPGTVPADDSRGPIYLRADVVEGRAGGSIEAAGKVELRTRNETVLADWLQYDFAREEIWGRGNVTLRTGLDWITGPELRFDTNSETGYFSEPKFFVGLNGARGEASEIRFLGPDNFSATDARYTSCVAPNNDWYLRSDEIEVDKLRKVGVARGAQVFFLNTPVMYAPWLEFPLSNERKSGFLTPTIGSTQVRGFEVAAPYYFNLAPNYDATLSTRFMTKRGLQLSGQGRYLFEPMAGELVAEIVPDDRQTDETRWAVAFKHNQQFNPWLTGYVNYSRVSDNLYFADFADRIAVTSAKTLPQEAGLVGNWGPLNLLVRAQAFQTLQDPDPANYVIPPYNMLPQVRATLAETDWQGLTFYGAAELTRFTQSALSPTGNRAYIYPSMRWMRQGSAWFFNAHVGIAAWQYDLDSPTVGVPSGSDGVVVPVTSVDAGLVFERDWSAFGRNYVQTLEPRAFYTYIPYRNQNQLPVFDTVQDDFNFTQLFSENRFVGRDRMGDTNQLAFAVTSRLLDPDTGVERLRVAVGQRFYFEDQKITLGTTPPQPAGSSDILVGVEGRLSESWALLGLVQYGTGSGQYNRFNAAARYTPGAGRVLGLSYRYSRELVDQVGGESELKQTYLAAQWPLTDHLSFVGAWNYSLPDRKTLEAVVGLEYNGDCWALRVVGQQLTTTSEQTTRSVFVQLELNGLARVGTNPLELLRRTVPGYLRTNDPSLRDRDRSFDPLPEF